jgi:hypothetical protein
VTPFARGLWGEQIKVREWWRAELLTVDAPSILSMMVDGELAGMAREWVMVMLSGDGGDVEVVVDDAASRAMRDSSHVANRIRWQVGKGRDMVSSRQWFMATGEHSSPVTALPHMASINWYIIHITRTSDLHIRA